MLVPEPSDRGGLKGNLGPCKTWRCFSALLHVDSSELDQQETKLEGGK